MYVFSFRLFFFVDIKLFMSLFLNSPRHYLASDYSIYSYRLTAVPLPTKQ